MLLWFTAYAYAVLLIVFAYPLFSQNLPCAGTKKRKYKKDFKINIEK